MSSQFPSRLPVNIQYNPKPFHQTLIMCLFSSDPPLSEEDIPAGLWLCHMCQMLQTQRKAIATKLIANDDDSIQMDVQKFKDSRPSTPINSDGVINAAKLRLAQKRSLSRVSSCSENSLSSDRDIKPKITRCNSEQYSNGAETVVSSTITTTIHDDNEKQLSEVETAEDIEQPAEESEPKIPTEDSEITENIVENPQESIESRHNEEQVGSTSNIDNVETNDSQPTNVTPSEVNVVQNGDEEVVDMRTPLEELIRAASILNPRQFELPRELNIFPQFPGDEKSE